MKTLTGIFLIAIKLYCSFKIIQWLYLQSIDKVNHPITEIQHILVFIIFDIWLVTTMNQVKNEIDDFRV